MGTDAMLLGAWTDPGNAVNILEIGTGCGVISLMMAQKGKAKITAIDIDEQSIRQAEQNFKNSPWKAELEALLVSFSEFADESKKRFDLIITNPPFFRSSLLPPDPRKVISKHDQLLTLENLVESSSALLSTNGRLSLILPVPECKVFESLAYDAGLFLAKKLIVFPKPGKAASRILIELQRERTPLPEISELVIRNEEGGFSSQYSDMTFDYHLFF